MLNYIRPKAPTVATWPFRQRQRKLVGPYHLSAQQLVRVAADALLLDLALVGAFVCFYLSTVWQGEPAAARVFLSNLGDPAWRLLPVTAVALVTFACSGFYTYSRTYRTATSWC
jgi:hypothetical protein